SKLKLLFSPLDSPSTLVFLVVFTGGLLLMAEPFLSLGVVSCSVWLSLPRLADSLTRLAGWVETASSISMGCVTTSSAISLIRSRKRSFTHCCTKRLGASRRQVSSWDSNCSGLIQVLNCCVDSSC